jgi:hypothetical protein
LASATHCGGLENRYGPDRSIEGSNPSPSAATSETPAQPWIIAAAMPGGQGDAVRLDALDQAEIARCGHS